MVYANKLAELPIEVQAKSQGSLKLVSTEGERELTRQLMQSRSLYSVHDTTPGPRQSTDYEQAARNLAAYIETLHPDGPTITQSKLRFVCPTKDFDYTRELARSLKECRVDPARCSTEAELNHALSQFTAAWYEKVVARDGHQLEHEVGKLTVVGLRGWNVRGQHGNEPTKFSDTICFITCDKDGYHCQEFLSVTTHPGIGKYQGKGAAWLRPGRYMYHLGTHRGVPGAARPVGDEIAAFRDFNGDMQIDAQEKARSIRENSTAVALNFHPVNLKNPAGPLPENVGGFSAGCQVFHMKWDRFHQVITPYFEKYRVFPYILVDLTKSSESKEQTQKH